jgi:hypothetical protein
LAVMLIHQIGHVRVAIHQRIRVCISDPPKITLPGENDFSSETAPA